MIKKLYDWVLDLAEKPHAMMALFAIAFIESSVFPIPPDVLLIAMVIANKQKWIKYFLVCLLGSVLGGCFGYLIGFSFWHAVGPWFLNHVFSEALFNKVQELYIQHDFWIVFTAGFTPIPYKVFTITAGVTEINLVTFIFASIFGRGGRFFLVALLLHHFGPPIKSFVEKYFNYVTIAFSILLIGGFILLKNFAH